MVEARVTLIETAVFFFVVMLVGVAPVHSAKTDVVILENGDHITGEVKKLENGILTFSTDFMGTISIEWPHVRSLSSSQHFEIITNDGKKFFGTFGEADEEGNLTFIGTITDFSFKPIQIVDIKPIGETWKDRIDASINLGYSFTKAQSVQQLNLSAYLTARKQGVISTLSASTIINSREDSPTTSRGDVEIRRDRVLKRPGWFYSLFAKGQENQELGLNLRISAGSGLGKYLILTNRTMFNLMAGLNITREDYEESEITENIELQLGLRYDFFLFDDPETDIVVDWKVLPSLSEWGRVRSELSARLMHEIINDLTVNLELSASYDSRPPENTTEKTDYSIVTSVGWKY